MHGRRLLAALSNSKWHFINSACRANSKSHVKGKKNNVLFVYLNFELCPNKRKCGQRGWTCKYPDVTLSDLRVSLWWFHQTASCQGSLSPIADSNSHLTELQRKKKIGVKRLRKRKCRLKKTKTKKQKRCNVIKCTGVSVKLSKRARKILRHR